MSREWHTCVYVCLFAYSCAIYNPQPLRVESLWISPVVIAMMHVLHRNSNNIALFNWYSIDHSVLVASSYKPALVHMCNNKKKWSQMCSSRSVSWISIGIMTNNPYTHTIWLLQVTLHNKWHRLTFPQEDTYEGFPARPYQGTLCSEQHRTRIHPVQWKHSYRD